MTVVLTAKAKHDHLVKVASVRDPLKCIAEFVWNGLDAGAHNVSVQLHKTPLGGITEIEIEDDGGGLSFERAMTDFNNIGDSWKARAKISPDTN